MSKRLALAVMAVLVGFLLVASVAAASTNLVGDASGIVTNPSFEEGVSGWNASGSGAGVALTRVGGGHSGTSSAQLSNGGTAPVNCQLNDSPNWVATTATGTYTASLWARSDTAGATLRLKLQEFRKDGGAFV